jgi:hypothetical protein
MRSAPVAAFGFDGGKPLDPIPQIGSRDQCLFADLADGNFAARNQLIEFGAPDCRHPTALGNGVKQLIHVGLATAGRDGPGDRARNIAGDGETIGQSAAPKKASRKKLVRRFRRNDFSLKVINGL